MQNHVLDYLDNIITKCPDKVAFANDKEELTFRDVYDKTRSIGSYLHKQGIYKEPVIVFMNKLISRTHYITVKVEGYSVVK